ncbi:MAG: hypothetical protein C5B54_11115 [Acidobacteria bacterium]|nr:MAG: hypothetical protein C5B54_11115 [Acidobacteriota bacterium]
MCSRRLEIQIMKRRELLFHVLVLFAFLLLLQAPRFGATFARILSPFFVPAQGFLDFDQGYYVAAKAILEDPSHLYHSTGPANFVNLPIIAWLFVPFTFFGLPNAGILMLWINIAATLAAFVLVQSRVRCEGWIQSAVTLTFLSSGPLMNALNLGQTTPLVLLALILFERFLIQEKSTAGIWLAAAALIKIPLLLLIPYLALRKKWKAFAAAILTLLIVFVVSVAIYGWKLHAEYFQLAFTSNLGTGIVAHNSQSFVSCLLRIFTKASLWSWEPIPLSSTLLTANWVFAGILIFAILTRSRSDIMIGMAMVLCASLIIAPIYWTHYGMFLLPIAAMFLSRRRFVIAVIAIILINFPTPSPAVIQRLQDVMWFRLAISHLFFGTLLLFVSLCLGGKKSLNSA